MTVGFTGTQHDLTEKQVIALARYVDNNASLDPEAHSGDCIGADLTFQRIVTNRGWKLVIHPPVDSKKRAFWEGPNVVILPEKPYRDRNQDIVDACHVLLACPSGEEKSQPRSGTWMTVRMARRAKKPVIIIPPEGGIVLNG